MEKYCVVYVRVSDEKQVDGYSLDSQTELCAKKAEELGYVVSKTFREEGVSAKTTDRPELQELLKYCKTKENKISAVFVYSYSRFSRNTVNFLTLKMVLSKSGIEVISYTEPGGDSPEATFITTILAAKDQYENETRARTVSNSLRKRFLEGHITARPPFGYLMIKENGKSHAIKDPNTFPILQNFWYRIVEEKLSLDVVAQELNKIGVKSIQNKRFTAKSLSLIFSNKFYMGILVSEKYGETPGLHEPMIDEEVFYQVRQIIKGRQPFCKKHAKLREDFALRGILVCPDCQNKTMMTSSWVRQLYPTYYCQSRKVHLIRSFKRDVVEKEFLKLLAKIKFTEKHMQHLAEMLKEKYAAKYQQLNISQDKIREDIEALKLAKKIARKKNVEGLYTDEEYLEMKDEYQSLIAVKESLLSEKKIDITKIDTILEFVSYFMSHLDQVFIKASPEGRLAIASSIFPDGVIFDGPQFRTPKLGRGYDLTRDILTTPMNSGEPERIRTSNRYLKRVLLYR